MAWDIHCKILRFAQNDGLGAVGNRSTGVSPVLPFVTLSGVKGLLPSPEASGEGLGVRVEILRFAQNDELGAVGSRQP